MKSLKFSKENPLQTYTIRNDIRSHKFGSKRRKDQHKHLINMQGDRDEF